MPVITFSILLILAVARSASAQWVPLLNGKDLDGWEMIGDGVWTVMRDGTLLGQRDPRKQSENQSWLYTKKEYKEFDLRLDWWLPLGGNSAVCRSGIPHGRTTPLVLIGMRNARLRTSDMRSS